MVAACVHFGHRPCARPWILRDIDAGLWQAGFHVDENSQEKTSGKNVATQAVSLLMQLSGYAGVISDLQQKVQLPVSVLNQGSVKKSTESFMKNIAQMRQHKEKAKKDILGGATQVLKGLSLGVKNMGT